ncbi:taurine ABC transporter permease TauC [Snodgrassella sp. CFCC 13594]|uniref:taurine ABC transporter permease TauC n=1 Tax=Snodgrassella sp. CFCC 13594 TaxID=1775559 RepID=UPI00083024C0|nr:taurine ABC transporter permease TauC [Snodgrassella sp. CFCC 13594]
MNTRAFTGGQPNRYLLATISIGSVFLVWWLITALHWIDPLFLPSPNQVWKKFLVIAQTGFMDATLWQHLAASLQRMLLSVLAAIIVGIPVGIAMGLNPWIRGLIDPLVELYRPIPPLAYLPLLVIWFGIGEATKILLIFLAILAPIIIATTQGMLVSPGNRIRAVQSLGASRWQIVRYVILPAALPNILTGIRIGLGVGWSTLVAAELIAAKQGLGLMVQAAAQFLVTDVVILGIILIALIALIIELALRYLQKELAPWYGHE